MVDLIVDILEIPTMDHFHARHRNHQRLPNTAEGIIRKTVKMMEVNSVTQNMTGMARGKNRLPANRGVGLVETAPSEFRMEQVI